MNGEEESNLKKKRRVHCHIPSAVVANWGQGHVSQGPADELDLDRVHRVINYTRFVDLQNMYKGSYEDGTLRHDSPYTQHIHW